MPLPSIRRPIQQTKLLWRRNCSFWRRSSHTERAQQHRSPSRSSRTLNFQETTPAFLEKATANKSLKFALWKLTKRFKRQVAPKFPVHYPDGTWAKSPQDRAEEFARNLEKRFQPFETASPRRVQLVAESLEAPLQMALSLKPTKITELKEDMKSLPNIKAAGEDDIKLCYFLYWFSTLLFDWDSQAPERRRILLCSIKVGSQQMN